MPINIPALAGRLSGDGDSDTERISQATFVPPHLMEQKVRSCSRMHALR